MTVPVQVRRPIVVPTQVLTGNPVAAAQQWTDVAHAAMWCRGKGAVLVPAIAPMTEIKASAEQVYRFRVKPRSSAVQRVWSVIVYLDSADTFTSTEVQIRCPATTGTLQSATASSASRYTEIVYTETLATNPEALVEVRTSPDGTIVSRKLTKSSGIPSWDDAVLRAIDKTAVLPRDLDGRVPPVLEISFRPRD